ncbi:MAG TPA: archaemetzincin [Planctomycetota bacterium]
MLSHAHATQLRTKPDKGDDEWVNEARAKVYASIDPLDEQGFVRLGKPKVGDWLFVYKENPQTLERYKLATPLRPDAKRRVIVLQPLGAFDAEKKQVLEKLCGFAAVFFQLPARIADPLPLEVPGQQLEKLVPLGNRHGYYNHQYDGNKIMQLLLQPKLPDDAAMYMGVTLEDLCTAEVTFAFGVASLDKRVAVMSLARFYREFWGGKSDSDDNILALRRTFKVFNHESAHMLGLTHCVFYRCSMNGSNDLTETDGAPMDHCPVCHRKLMWNIGFDATKRYQQLATFYRALDLCPEADWAEKRAQRWAKVVETEKLKKSGDE